MSAQPPTSMVVAWWNLAPTVVKKLANDMGVPLQASSSQSSDLAVILEASVAVLGKSEAEVLPSLAQRLADMQDNEELLSELLQVDEAAKCLTKDDGEALEAEKVRLKTVAERQAAFASEFRSRAVASRAHGSSSSSSARRKKVVRKPLPQNPSAFAQRDLKRLMPSNAYLWQSRSGHGAWCVRVPPFKDISRSRNAHGDFGSFQIVLTLAWKQHCLLNGLSEEDVPLEGLAFDAV